LLPGDHDDDHVLEELEDAARMNPPDLSPYEIRDAMYLKEYGFMISCEKIIFCQVLFAI